MFSCSLIERKYMNISFKYTWTNWLMQSQKIAVISCWNVVCCNHPSALLGFWMCQVLWRTLSYGHVPVQCVFVCMLWTYRALSDMPPWPYHYEWYPQEVREWGHIFDCVTFCSHKLKTVHSLLLFFDMQSIGTTWCATAGIHHCAVVYLSIFWESSSWKCSGHFGRW